MAKWELLYTRLRKGYVPSVTKSRSEIITKFLGDFKRLGMTERDLVNKTPKELSMILLQLCHDKLYAVPFQLLAFDIKYLDKPRFTPSGPTSCIAELAAYHPESGKMFERLILPSSSDFTAPVDIACADSEVTKLTLSQIKNHGVPFSTAWGEFLTWLYNLPEPQPTVSYDSLDGKGTFGHLPCVEKDGSAYQSSLLENPITSNKHLLYGIEKKVSSEQEKELAQAQNLFQKQNQRLLLISHGGRLADVSMLRWECKKASLKVPKQITFGDSYGIIKEKHRRRPVTQNKLPAMWGVKALSLWMSMPQYKEVKGHQALSDAISTWEVLVETLRRYGVEHLTAKQQLGEIFYKSAFDAVIQTRVGK
ncbi:CK1 family protein kinase [Perkinsela sp. CCAP 1560/4]|nr:CK1 family protein kinase [Perkinsela sp. CCAP 1560/4]|eukprot:KNH04782.1 CK1 family protein kinase [Perkinsela sp. CCAP 1560/4]